MANSYTFNTDTGLITADTSSVLSDVQGEFKVALGQNLDLSSQTPAGRLIDAETAARTGVLNYNAAVANQINPDDSGGIFLASVFGLMGGSPFAATPTVLNNCKVWGTQGASVTSLTIYDQDANMYGLQTAVTINTLDVATGKYYAVATFQALVAGPTAAAAGTKWLLLAPVPTGVDSVTCDSDGVAGVGKETDVACRQRRKNSLALQSANSARAAKSALSNVPGVLSSSVRENDDSVQVTVDGVVMPRNSLWVCVQGGIDADIAAALLKAKGAGCKWTTGVGTAGQFGSGVTVTLTDPITEQQYNVIFTRPLPKLASCVVTYDVNEAFGNFEPQNAIVDAITKYQNGQINSDPGMVIGRNLSAFELAGAVSTLYPGLYISNCTVTSGGVTASEIPANIWEVINIPSGQINAQPRA